MPSNSPSLETDKQLLYRLGRGTWTYNLANVTADEPALYAVQAYQLGRNHVVLGGGVCVAGPGPLPVAVAIEGYRNGVLLPGTSLTIPAGQPSDTFIPFDEAAFAPFELFSGDVLRFIIDGDNMNTGFVVGVSLRGRPD